MAETDPKHWFLDTLPFTEGNEVIAFVDGQEFMRHVYDRFAQMKAGDAVYYTAWRVSPTQELTPDAPAPDSPIGAAFAKLIAKGVTVRVLAWYVPVFTNGIIPHLPVAPKALQHVKDNRNFVDDVRAASKKVGSVGSAYLDERLSSKVASHHQKSMVLSSQGEYWAYLGGIDLSLDRWDVPDHSSPSHRQKELFDGWHDVHCAIRGPAVLDIWRNFKDRWNDRTPPHKWPGPQANEVPKPIQGEISVPAASKGSLSVQRLRTLACGVYDFMPRRQGEQTARLGINRAIDQAKHYVYIEEQYLWPCTTIDCLARAVKERDVHVFLMLAREGFPPPLSTASNEMRREVLSKIEKGKQQNVVCCHLEKLNSDALVYVHSKFMIVDDRYVAIGSTNVGLRSHTTDSELHVGIVDANTVDGTMNGRPARVCAFARDLRIKIWQEHLGITDPTKLLDPIAAKALWPKRTPPSKPAKVHHAVWHNVPKDTEGTLKQWYNAIKTILELIKLPDAWPNYTSKEKSAEESLLEEAIAVFDNLDVQFQKDVKISDLIGGAAWWLLKPKLLKLVKEKLLNVETKCS